MLYQKLKLAALCGAIIFLAGCQSIKFHVDQSPYIPPALKLKNKRMALVLGAGGAKGFAHLGVLEELSSFGIKPDLIIGCSAGAIVGSLYASNPNIENLKKMMLLSKREDVISMNYSVFAESLYDSERLHNYLKKNLSVKVFEELKIPFIAVATNLQYGNLTAFSSGDLASSVLASASVPGAFAPVKINEQYFLDGAIVNPVPAALAKDLGFDIVIAVNIANQLPKTEPKNILGLLNRTMEISYLSQSKLSAACADFIIDFEFKDGIDMFGGDHNDYLYELGRLNARAIAPKILARLRKT